MTTHPSPLLPSLASGLGILELIHCIVETLDSYFQNVCELDIMCVASQRLASDAVATSFLTLECLGTISKRLTSSWTK